MFTQSFSIGRSRRFTTLREVTALGLIFGIYVNVSFCVYMVTARFKAWLLSIFCRQLKSYRRFLRVFTLLVLFSECRFRLRGKKESVLGDGDSVYDSFLTKTLHSFSTGLLRTVISQLTGLIVELMTFQTSYNDEPLLHPLFIYLTSSIQFRKHALPQNLIKKLKWWKMTKCFTKHYLKCTHPCILYQMCATRGVGFCCWEQNRMGKFKGSMTRPIPTQISGSTGHRTHWTILKFSAWQVLKYNWTRGVWRYLNRWSTGCP